MEAVAEFAATGGPVLGICNGFQVLCEAGLLPGALLLNRGLRFICRQLELIAERTDSPFDGGASTPASALSIPVKHGEGRYFAPGEDARRRSRRTGRSPTATRRGRTPTARRATSPGSATRTATCSGLMPHPEHAVDPLTGSTDGAARLRSARAGFAADRSARTPRARPHRLRVRADRREARARAQRRSSWRCSACSGPSTAPTSTRASCCGRLPTEGARVVMGPGENAGAVDVGDGYAVAFKVESHNHPSAVEPFQGAATGVGGILRDVFALGARPIAILDSLRFGELDSERSRFLLDGAVRGIGHYGNSIGVANGRRRDLLRGALRAQLPGQRDVRRHRQDRGHGARRRGRGRQRGGADGRLDRARRDRRRLGARLRRARRGRRRRSARRCRSATPSRSRSCSSAAWSCSRRGCWSHCRTSAPPG